MTDTLTFERFQKLINQTVTLQVGDQTLSAQVTEVNPHNKHGDSPRDPFSVIFVTDASDSYGQQLYTVTHEEWGQEELFLVPLGPKGEGMSYEAIIT